MGFSWTGTPPSPPSFTQNLMIMLSFLVGIKTLPYRMNRKGLLAGMRLTTTERSGMKFNALTSAVLALTIAVSPTLAQTIHLAPRSPMTLRARVPEVFQLAQDNRIGMLLAVEAAASTRKNT